MKLQITENLKDKKHQESYLNNKIKNKNKKLTIQIKTLLNKKRKSLIINMIEPNNL